ncbi:MAG: hypothetical protein CVU31_00245 [Betaproteobacteria bacterium HGW-Betaproteobacteria-4]|jgi:hypothetical protein|nr:MAG: hypothetical protein CVU31_00245 [Betaproteobacteria bacterium HGW-Betaproteobacteria-4]
METRHPFYQAETYRPENSTGYLVSRLAQVVTRELDRRIVNLELTDEGLQVSAEVPKILANLSNQVLVGFYPEEFTVFRDLLGRALSIAQALSDEGSQP